LILPADGSPRALRRHDSAALHVSRASRDRAGWRVESRRFENNLDDERGWRAELIRRLSIGIEGVRPPLFVDEVRQRSGSARVPSCVRARIRPDSIRQARLDPRNARASFGIGFPAFVSAFVTAVADEQGLERPR
jgi:hypothetical protein